MPTGDAYSSGHLVPSPLGLAYVLLVETNPFPNLSLFYRTMLFEYPSVLSRFCFIGVLRHMQRYFSHICDGTDVQGNWRRGWSWAPNAIDILQGSLTCPSCTDTGTTLFIRWFRHTANMDFVISKIWCDTCLIWQYWQRWGYKRKGPKSAIYFALCLSNNSVFANLRRFRALYLK